MTPRGERRACAIGALLLALMLPALPAQAIVLAEEKARLMLPSGTEIVATVRRPKEAKTPKPALLLFGGFEEAAHVLDLVHPKEHVVLASFDYPFKPPRRFVFPESLRFAPDAKRAVSDMIEGIRELTDHLARQTYVDRKRITIIGASFGAPFALAAAANDTRLRGIALVHGFARVIDVIEYRIRLSWRRKIGWLATPAAWLAARVGAFYLDAPSPESSIARLSPTQQVLVINAENDTIIPRKAVDALWRALETSKAQVTKLSMPGDHLMPGSDALIETLTEAVLKWMRSSDLLER